MEQRGPAKPSSRMPNIIRVVNPAVTPRRPRPIAPSLNAHLLKLPESPSPVQQNTPVARKRARKSNVATSDSPDDPCGRIGLNILQSTASDDVNGVRDKPEERSLKRRLHAVEIAETHACAAEDVNYFDPATSDSLFDDTIKFWKSNAKRARLMDKERQLSRTSNNSEIEEFKSAIPLENSSDGPILGPFDDYPQDQYRPFPGQVVLQQAGQYIQYVPVPVPFMFHQYQYRNR